MKKKQIDNRIIKILNKIFKKNILNNFSQINERKWDSLNHMLIIIELEKEFGLKISINDLERLNSKKKIVNFVEKKYNLLK
jgi:acyl carrier protein